MKQTIFYIFLNVGVGAVIVWLSIILIDKFYLRAESESEDFIFAKEFAAAAFHSSEYQATSGGRIPNYVDTDEMMKNPELLIKSISKVVKHLKKYIKKHPVAKVCFIEKDSGPLGMLAYAGLISTELNRPISTIRPRRDILRMAVEGAPIRTGDKIVLVQDVLTTSFQVVQAAHKIQQLGAQVLAVVALVDRGQEKNRELSDMHIETISQLNLSELETAKEAGSVNSCVN